MQARSRRRRRSNRWNTPFGHCAASLHVRLPGYEQIYLKGDPSLSNWAGCRYRYPRRNSTPDPGLEQNPDDVVRVCYFVHHIRLRSFATSPMFRSSLDLPASASRPASAVASLKKIRGERRRVVSMRAKAAPTPWLGTTRKRQSGCAQNTKRFGARYPPEKGRPR